MPRKFIDCRQFPSDMNCTVAISADSEAELLEAAVQHAVAVHRHQDTPELRVQTRGAILAYPVNADIHYIWGASSRRNKVLRRSALQPRPRYQVTI